jgi:anaerobic selenocysteine-containing dehydrogenase
MSKDTYNICLMCTVRCPMEVTTAYGESGL